MAPADERPVNVTLRRSCRQRAQDELTPGLDARRVLRANHKDDGIAPTASGEFPLAAPTNRTTCPLEQLSRFVEHVKGYRVIANDALASSGAKRGEDWTARLQQAANA